MTSRRRGDLFRHLKPWGERRHYERRAHTGFFRILWLPLEVIGARHITFP